MRVYLVRTKEYIGGFRNPFIHVDQIAGVFEIPSEFGCERIDGHWHRLRCGDTEIQIVDEVVGYEVYFDGTMEVAVADRLVGVLAVLVERVIGDPTEWLRMPDLSTGLHRES
jgi:hypothetical protein